MDKLGRPQAPGIKTFVPATARKHSQIARRLLKIVPRSTPRQLLSKSSTPKLSRTSHSSPALDSPSAVIGNFIVPIRQGSTTSDSETKIGESIIAPKRSLTQPQNTEPQSQLSVIALLSPSCSNPPQFHPWQSEFGRFTSRRTISNMFVITASYCLTFNLANTPYTLRLHNDAPIMYIQS